MPLLQLSSIRFRSLSTYEPKRNDELFHTMKIALFPRIIGNTIVGVEPVLGQGVTDRDAIPVLRTALTGLRLCPDQADPKPVALQTSVQRTLTYLEGEERRRKTQEAELMKNILTTFDHELALDRDRIEPIEALAKRIRKFGIRHGFKKQQNDVFRALARAITEHHSDEVRVDQQILLKILNRSFSKRSS